MESSMPITALNIGSLLVIFAFIGACVVVLKSPANMRRLSIWLYAKAHAEEELLRATKMIRAQQRAYQLEREREMGIEPESHPSGLTSFVERWRARKGLAS